MVAMILNSSFFSSDWGTVFDAPDLNCEQANVCTALYFRRDVPIGEATVPSKTTGHLT
jgi:hypothetical protein